jgi:hypothetical protein
MNKEKKKEARQRRVREQKEAKLLKTITEMSSVEITDAELRGMNTQDGIPQYLFEIKEVNEATKRMKLIDKAISEMSSDEQSARDHRLESQKRSALNDEDLYLLSDDAYDAWVSGVLPTIGGGNMLT